MGRETGITWTRSTFNPWRGCQRVSPGCEHCYAETLSKRNHALLGRWGPPAAGGTRVIASPAMWREPLRWNAAAKASGQQHRVFCSSLADVFEDLPQLEEPRRWLWALIEATPHLTWLLLTKRPENVLRMAPRDWSGRRTQCCLRDTNCDGDCDRHPHGVQRTFPDNVWMGTTVEDKARAQERIPHLLRVPARVRFLSMEPQLELINIAPWLFADMSEYGKGRARLNQIHWVIQGGESGGQARPFDLDWARHTRDLCADAGVPYFFKQTGAQPIGLTHPTLGAILPSGAGSDVTEWPTDMRVQQFPEDR
ncbi:MAG: phage Gp37/Gp68 family protein [Flavobacteriales bacterium]|nr:phage Gp37/Gp68 family protein [Flavobacteriales bacterium]